MAGGTRGNVRWPSNSRRLAKPRFAMTRKAAGAVVPASGYRVARRIRGREWQRALGMRVPGRSCRSVRRPVAWTEQRAGQHIRASGRDHGRGDQRQRETEPALGERPAIDLNASLEPGHVSHPLLLLAYRATSELRPGSAVIRVTGRAWSTSHLGHGASREFWVTRGLLVLVRRWLVVFRRAL
jgi:hypothetical protein